jgi:hypothetical protein
MKKTIIIVPKERVQRNCKKYDKMILKLDSKYPKLRQRANILVYAKNNFKKGEK